MKVWDKIYWKPKDCQEEGGSGFFIIKEFDEDSSEDSSGEEDDLNRTSFYSIIYVSVQNHGAKEGDQGIAPTMEECLWKVNLGGLVEPISREGYDLSLMKGMNDDEWEDLTKDLESELGDAIDSGALRALRACVAGMRGQFELTQKIRGNHIQRAHRGRMGISIIRPSIGSSGTIIKVHGDNRYTIELDDNQLFKDTPCPILGHRLIVKGKELTKIENMPGGGRRKFKKSKIKKKKKRKSNKHKKRSKRGKFKKNTI
jgi:hypothetical protein